MFDGRLERFGVRKYISKEQISKEQISKDDRVLIDGKNYLWVWPSANGQYVGSYTRFNSNNPNHILRAIARIFDTEIVSENEPQYWGFETWEEYAAYEEKREKERRDKFYEQILKHVRGEKIEYESGRYQRAVLDIAKKLIAANADLTSPDKKDELLQAVKEIYARDHTMKIPLIKEIDEEIPFW